MSQTQLPDDRVAELISKIQHGEDQQRDCQAIHQLFQPAVRAFFAKRGFSTEECADLTQDTFLRVFEHIGGLRDPARFRYWLFEIAANVYRNELRRRGADMRDGIEEVYDETPRPDGTERTHVTPALPSREPDALADAVRREQHAALVQAIGRLPAKMRQCAYLRFCRQRDYAEIAELMRISIQTVKAHLHQAKQRLVAELAPKGSG